MANMPLTPTPVLTPNAGKYIKQVDNPENTLEIIVGRVQVFALLAAPTRIQVGDETVANVAVLGPGELSLQGLRVGTTVLNVWFAEQNSQRSVLVSFLVRVLPDPDSRARLERAYRNLENEVNRAFPNSRISLSLVGDKLGVFGQARDIAEANMIMRFVQSNVLPEAADSPDLGRFPADASSYYRSIPAYHRQVVNMMRVVGEQQVMLQVQVVEVDRAAARSIGLNFGVLRNNGQYFVGGQTGNLATATSTAGTGFATFTGAANTIGLTGLGGLSNLPFALDFGQIQFAIAALRNLSYARFLAEPNLVAINGQSASFQAGSLLPVPVISGATANQGSLTGVNFIPTGVQLQFTPYITDRDRVRLTMNAEISDRDLNVSPTLIDGAAIPSLTTRNFQTTVELREGQTLAVAGLIQNKLDADSSRIPFLGHIPLLGRLASYDRIGHREMELVILVTPRLVRPMECGEVPPPPGLDILEPDDCEFYVHGRLESHSGLDFRSPIRTDKSRQESYRWLEQTMLIGPSGPTMDVQATPPNRLGAVGITGTGVAADRATGATPNPGTTSMGNPSTLFNGQKSSPPAAQISPPASASPTPYGGPPANWPRSLPPAPRVTTDSGADCPTCPKP